jgi:hypothetical protein
MSTGRGLSSSLCCSFASAACACACAWRLPEWPVPPRTRGFEAVFEEGVGCARWGPTAFADSAEKKSQRVRSCPLRIGGIPSPGSCSRRTDRRVPRECASKLSLLSAQEDVADRPLPPACDESRRRPEGYPQMEHSGGLGISVLPLTPVRADTHRLCFTLPGGTSVNPPPGTRPPRRVDKWEPLEYQQGLGPAVPIEHMNGSPRTTAGPARRWYGD